MKQHRFRKMEEPVNLASRLVVLAFVLAFGGAASSSGGSPADKLDMFVGTWSGVGSMSGTAGAPPTHVRGTNRCAWSDGKAFLICQGDATIAGTRHRGLSIFSYNPDARAYRFLNITAAGANRTLLSFAGNTWTYDDEDTDAHGKKTYFRTLNIFDSPDSYRFVTEASPDKVHWTKNGSGTSTRVR